MLVSSSKEGQLVHGTDLEKERDSSITVRVEKEWKSRNRVFGFVDRLARFWDKQNSYRCVDA
jgi:hypothetical protein